jgi:hypothetical protein
VDWDVFGLQFTYECLQGSDSICFQNDSLLFGVYADGLQF